MVSVHSCFGRFLDPSWQTAFKPRLALPFSHTGPLMAQSAWRKAEGAEKVESSLQRSWASSFPRHLEGESISKRMGASYFSLCAVMQDHTEHRFQPARNPPAKFSHGFFTLRGKKANKHDVELKVFYFSISIGEFHRSSPSKHKDQWGQGRRRREKQWMAPRWQLQS